MKNLVKNSIVILLIILPFVSLAQDGCRGLQRYCSPSNKKEGFVYNGQSVFGSFAQGDTAEVSIVVYKDMDYRIVLCSGDKAIDGQIAFKVVEMISKPYWEDTKVIEKVEEYDAETNTTVTKEVEKVTKKRVYGKVEDVRYDNAQHESDPEFSFTSDKTRRLIIKVYVPEVGGSTGLEEDALTCVGMLIEHKQSEKTGFRR